jgi:hypothetical protein
MEGTRISGYGGGLVIETPQMKSGRRIFGLLPFIAERMLIHLWILVEWLKMLFVKQTKLQGFWKEYMTWFSTHALWMMKYTHIVSRMTTPARARTTWKCKNRLGRVIVETQVRMKASIRRHWRRLFGHYIEVHGAHSSRQPSY